VALAADGSGVGQDLPVDQFQLFPGGHVGVLSPHRRGKEGLEPTVKPTDRQTRYAPGGPSRLPSPTAAQTAAQRVVELEERRKKPLDADGAVFRSPGTSRGRYLRRTG
jgi:hypothetical protein